MSSSSTRRPITQGLDKRRISAARDPRAVDDMRIGRVARVLRQRLGLRQADVARSAACSQDEISLLERGRIEGMSLRRLRRLFQVFDAEVVVIIRWRGGSLDHLLDARHASLADATIGLLAGAGWVVQPEVSYSVYGERGSIDLLAWHEPTRTLLVVELKTELTSIEETLRRHDTKIRLGPEIARERFGWDPKVVARLLVLPEGRTSRRRVDRHQATLRRVYPLATSAVKRWLRSPSGGAIGGILFLADTNDSRVRHRIRQDIGQKRTNR
jgi:transcriptional regulator with XRE-family HTH domain